MSAAWNNTPQVNHIARKARRVFPLALLVAAACALSACSTVSNIWHKNRPILGDPTAKNGGGKNAPGAKDPYPNLGDVPARPKTSESYADRRSIAKDLIADRDKNEYTASGLRAGQETAAPPPPPPVPGSQTVAQASSNGRGVSADDDDKEPGFFARLFGGRKKTAAPDPNKLEPLPAQPVAPVTVEPTDKPQS